MSSLAAVKSAAIHRPKRLLLRFWWYVLAYFIAAYYVVHELIDKKRGKSIGLHAKDLRRCNRGETAIVTGGSRGIGLELVNYLLQYNYNVIIGSSSTEETRDSLAKSLQVKYPQASVEVCHLDLASLRSVKTFSDKFISSGRPLNLLINNAGIMFVPHEETEEGFERHFAVNYLSHFLLSLLLLPLLEKSAEKEKKSRIINSTSCIHYVGSLNVDDLQGRSNYSKYYAYMQSKLAQVMFTYTLQSFLSSRGSKITVNCCHPGVVNTDLMNCVWWTSYIGSIFFKTAKEGAETVVYAALAEEMEGIGGKYLEECHEVKSSKLSNDQLSQRKLWIASLKYVKPWLQDPLYKEMTDFLS